MGYGLECDLGPRFRAANIVLSFSRKKSALTQVIFSPHFVRAKTILVRADFYRLQAKTMLAALNLGPKSPILIR